MNARTQLTTIAACAALAGLGLAAPAAASGHHPAHKKGTIVTSRVISSFGRVLANSKGRVMYLFSKDTRGTSHCHAGCASAWPRVMSPAKPRAGTDVKAGHLARTPSHQATYFGHPLYYFVGDPGKGHTGEGEEGFYLVSTSGKAVHKKKPTGGGTPKPYVPPAPTTAADLNTGQVTGNVEALTDNSNGHTLYYLTGDKHGDGTFSCTSTCQKTWKPLLTDGDPTFEAGSDVNQTVESKLTRADDNNEVQVTYNGYPVYTFVGDTSSGTDVGQGTYADGGYWYYVAP